MDQKGKIFCGICLLIVVGLIVVLSLSFKKVQPTEVGLDFSANSLKLDTETLFEPNLHYIGVGHRLILYPTTAQEIDMSSVRSRTKDGLVIDLSCTLLYTHVQDAAKLASLYLNFKEDHVEAYTVIARGVIRDVASTYTAFNFWEDRNNITIAMEEELTTRLQDVHAQVDTFILSTFTLPVQFEAAVESTDVQKQERETVQFERKKAETEIATQLKRADVEKVQYQQQANATAESLLLQAQVNVDKIDAAVYAEIQAYSKIKNGLQLTPEQFTSLMWIDTVKAATKSPKTFSVDVPPVIS